MPTALVLVLLNGRLRLGVLDGSVERRGFRVGRSGGAADNAGLEGRSNAELEAGKIARAINVDDDLGRNIVNVTSRSEDP